MSIRNYYDDINAKQFELKIGVKNLKELIQRIRSIGKGFKNNTLKDIEFSLNFKYL